MRALNDLAGPMRATPCSMKTKDGLRIQRAIGAVSVVIAAFFAAGAARAHGGIPRADSILFEPGDPSHVVLRSGVGGLFELRDRSPTWSYVCAEAYQANSLNYQYAPTVVAAGGRIIVAAGFGGLWATDDGCSWRLLGSFAESIAQSVTATDSTGNGFLMLTTQGVNGKIQSHLYRSSNRGDTWAQVGGGLENDVAPSSVAVAPSDPNRIYVGGRVIDGPPVLLASTDAGKTWVRHDVPALDDLDSSSTVLVAGVHPTRPDAVVLRLDEPEGLGQNEADRLLASPDGGKTWLVEYTSTADLPGFTVSPDGQKVLIAGPEEGVQEAPLDDAFGGRAMPFTQIFAGRVWGLSALGEKLYAGNDNFVTPGARFTLGVSSDGGRSFMSVMTLCDVKFGACASGSTVDQVCQEAWQNYELDFAGGPACTQTGMSAGGAASTASDGGKDLGGGGQTARGGDGGGAAPGSAGSGGSPSTGGSDGADAGTPRRAAADSHLHISKIACSLAAGETDPTSAFAVLGAAAAFCRRSAVRRAARAGRKPAT
jgi:hypothetical protein